MDVASLKVTELKDELKKRGLPTTGLKKELADRLQESVDEVTNPDQEPQDEPQLAVEAGEATTEEVRAEPTGSQDQAIEPEPPATSNSDSPTPAAAAPATAAPDANVTTDSELQEQVLGDLSYTQSGAPEGDLGLAMEAAEAEGKAERKEAEAEREDEVDGLEGKKDDVDQVEAVKEDEMQVDDSTVGKRKREDGNENGDEEGAREAKKGKMDDGNEVVKDAASAEAMTTKTTTEPSKPSPPQSKPTPPNPLRHARHQPTRAIYIDNLRRPLDVGELKDLLLEHGELDEEAGGVKGGMWVSGVKSHVYAVFQSQESSIKAAVALHDYAFQPIAKTTLHIEFLPASIVPSLIAQEEAAWKDGRKQLALSISTVPQGEGWEGSDRTIQVVPQKVPGVNVPGRRIPGLANAPPPPMPIRAMPGIAGIGGMPVIPPRNARGSGVIPPPSSVAPGNAPTGPRTMGVGARSQEPLVRPERETRGFLRTKTRPVLFYREAIRK